MHSPSRLPHPGSVHLDLLTRTALDPHRRPSGLHPPPVLFVEERVLIRHAALSTATSRRTHSTTPATSPTAAQAPGGRLRNLVPPGPSPASPAPATTGGGPPKHQGPSPARTRPRPIRGREHPTGATAHPTPSQRLGHPRNSGSPHTGIPAPRQRNMHGRGCCLAMVSICCGKHSRTGADSETP